MRPPLFTQKEFDAQLPKSIKRTTPYETLDKNSEFKCLECKHRWSARARFAISKGCPNCNKLRSNQAARKTDPVYRKQVRLANPKLQVLDEYTHWQEPLRFKHLDCGHTWKDLPPRYARRSVPCPTCVAATKYTQSYFDKHLPKTMKRVSTYNSPHTQCTIHCSVCQADYTSTADKILKLGCAVCNNKAMGLRSRKTNAEFIAELSAANPDIVALSEYVTAKIDVLFKHTTCGHTWKNNPRRILAGVGCPKCTTWKRQAKLGKRMVLVRGFEDYALSYMQTLFAPEQIAVEDEREVPTFVYTFRGSTHRYFPDMYVPHINTIVEVKSASTIGLLRNLYGTKQSELFYRTRAKALNVMEAGYKFKLLVMTPHSEPLKIPKQWYTLTFRQFKEAVTPGVTIYGKPVKVSQ